MVDVKCEICGKVEQKMPARAKKYRTCSIPCRSKLTSLTAKSKRVEKTCEICGAKWLEKPSHADLRHTCSKECFKEYRSAQMIGEGNHQYGLKGKKNASWKTDRRITHYGYVIVRHESATRPDGFIFEHTLVMEKDIGRKLHGDECIHHINHDKQDNRLENLQLMTKGEHVSLHNRLRNQNRNEDDGRYCK